MTTNPTDPRPRVKPAVTTRLWFLLLQGRVDRVVRACHRAKDAVEIKLARADLDQLRQEIEQKRQAIEKRPAPAEIGVASPGGGFDGS